MKKVIKIVLLVCMIFFKCNIPTASALRIEVEEMEDIYVSRSIFGRFSQTMLHKYSMNGLHAYCIMPGVRFDNGGYIVSDEEILSFEDEEYIELVAHFSYGHTGSKELYYYMAAQQLIWERLGITNIKWKTGLFSSTYYNITNYIDDIEEKIINYYKLPSFDGESFSGVSNNEIEIEDINNVLENYDIINADKFYGYTDNNLFKFKIPNNYIGTEEISFKFKDKLKNETKYYVKNDSQTIGSFGLSYIAEAKIYVTAFGGYINLNKYDSDSKTNISTGSATLENAVYKIRNFNDDVIGEYSTNITGEIVSEELPYGEYTIIEKTAPEGYLLDDTIYKVVIDQENVLLEVYDEVIKEDWIISKLYGSYITDEYNFEEGAVFEFYSNVTLYNTFTTDSDGEINITLPFGKYNVKQISGKDNYDFVDDFIINVNGENINTIINLFNEKYAVKLKIIKLDNSTKDIIEDFVSFKIKNTITNEYVLNDNGSYLFETMNGVLLTNIYLEAGNYALEEVEPPDGYKELSGPITFTVDSKNELIMDSDDRIMILKIYNEKLPKLPQTGVNNYSYIIGFILILLSSIFVGVNKYA